MTSGHKDIGVRKTEFVAKTEFLCKMEHFTWFSVKTDAVKERAKWYLLCRAETINLLKKT